METIIGHFAPANAGRFRRAGLFIFTACLATHLARSPAARKLRKGIHYTNKRTIRIAFTDAGGDIGLI